MKKWTGQVHHYHVETPTSSSYNRTKTPATLNLKDPNYLSDLHRQNSAKSGFPPTSKNLKSVTGSAAQGAQKGRKSRRGGGGGGGGAAASTKRANPFLISELISDMSLTTTAAATTKGSTGRTKSNMTTAKSMRKLNRADSSQLDNNDNVTFLHSVVDFFKGFFTFVAASPNDMYNHHTTTTTNPRGTSCWCHQVDSEAILSAMMERGQLYTSRGQYHEALQAWNITLTIQRTYLGSTTHPAIGSTLNMMGIILSRMGPSFTHMALEAFEESLIIRQRTLGPGDEETANTVHNMWILFHNAVQQQERAKKVAPDEDDDDELETSIHKYRGMTAVAKCA